MGGLSTKRRRYSFDPFNLQQKDNVEEHRIKFERLSRTVKTKPLWWLIVVFFMIIIIYYYLTKSIS